jgi:apolipoprotein N-acyltransferase
MHLYHRLCEPQATVIAFVIFDGQGRHMDRITAIIARFPGCSALLLGAISVAGFAPIGQWWILLLCLAALIALLDNIKQHGLFKRFWIGYCFGFGQFSIGLSWMAHAFTYQDAMPQILGWFAAPLLSLYLGVFPGLATAAASILARRDMRKLVPLFAGCWIITEYLRSVVLTGFPWNPLSAAFVDMAQISMLIGTYGASGVVILAAGSVWLLGQRRWFAALLCLSIPAFAVLMAIAEIPGPDDRPTKTLLHIVQPNIGQQDKYRKDYETANFAKLAALTQSGNAAKDSTAKPRLILWSEAAIPDFIGEKDIDAFDARMRIAKLMQPGDILLTGADKIFSKTTKYAGYSETRTVGAANSLFALNDKGAILWRYDKAHLVPFGEFMPWRPLLEPLGLQRLVPGNIDFWPGAGPRSNVIRGMGVIGTQICYEIIFSGNVVDRKYRPDFLFNPSNDAWFGSSYPPQMVAQTRLRAIEEGLPVVRSTPTGISAVIDADGRILQQIANGKAAYIAAALPARHDPTPFARFGNILPLCFAVMLLLSAMLLPLARGRTSR